MTTEKLETPPEALLDETKKKERRDSDLPIGKTEADYTPLNKSCTTILQEIKTNLSSPDQEICLICRKREIGTSIANIGKTTITRLKNVGLGGLPRKPS